MVGAFWVSFGLVFVAELGDKSQLMALAFASRYRAWHVIVGVTVSTAVVHAVSVVLGSSVATTMPTSTIHLVAGLAFIGFAAWTLRGDELNDDDRRRVQAGTRSAIVAVGLAFLLAELGDKTMLATITLATQYEGIGTWMGSTVGMVAADALAIVVGATVGTRLPERTLRWGAAALFTIFGALLLADALAA